jgi:hypothetical protein
VPANIVDPQRGLRTDDRIERKCVGAEWEDVHRFLPIPVSGPLSTTARGWRLSGPRDVKNGLAYDPTKDFVRYTNGVLNYWNKMERPGVLLQDGM